MGIEIDAVIDEPNYLLIPESEDCIAESEEDWMMKTYPDFR